MVYLSLSISTIFLEGLFLFTSSDIPLIVSIVLTAFPVPSNLSTISAPIGVDLKASSIEAIFQALSGLNMPAALLTPSGTEPELTNILISAPDKF